MASTSYNQTTSSSAPTSPPTLWDVFLSFRENYASSSWCLEELVEILDCYKRMKRLVIPVFYNIDPSAVRYQIENFRETFEKHQSRHDAEKVNVWCLTLNEVADFSGYHISENRSQADIVDEVVDRVLLAINPITLDVARYPVGLVSRVKAISTLIESEGVIRIGIHGMGGVGKTTLAKAVYNQNYQQFEGSCFLANIREASRTEHGLVCLQKQLIADVLKLNNINIGNVDQGIELIRARICSKRVLLVIDDLDDPKPLEALEGSFSPGSITIITTRNEDLLDSMKVQAKYKVNELDDDQSRQLFAQHAFGNYKVSDNFKELSEVILKRAGGLPLALEVFGSNMFNKPEEDWRWFIDRLNCAPIDNIEKKLVVSFDALKSVDPMLQNIFLDVACFYIGREKEEVVKIMETCYTYVNRNIDILKKRCLITIDEFGILGMHDLLRDMGREIARNNSPDEPGKHSRLWVSEDIDTVLKNYKGTKAIQGIISNNFIYGNEVEEVTVKTKSFKRMSKLRFLYLNNVNLTGSFKQTFEDLRWLHWECCPLKCLPSDFYPGKLVILEMPRSNMRMMWELNMVPRVFDKLKTLNLSNSPNLITTPDFTTLPCLKTLNLEGCSNLEEVHISIGCLVSLVGLDLRNCLKLKSLPNSICSLRALEALTIAGCSSLEVLPTELGYIESLEVLNAWGLTVSKIPDSIGVLSNLVELRLSYNENLETLPESICNLRSLELLDVRFCEKIVELPDRLGKITGLRQLRASNVSQLKMIPDISQLSMLTELDLCGCRHLLSIEELPPNLKRIDAIDCTSLVKLPNLSNLKQLITLNLSKCSSLTEILGLEELTSLMILILRGCSSSLLAYTLTEHFFQIFSGFGHIMDIKISLAEYPDWISQSSGSVKKMSFDLPPDASDYLLAMIFCFECAGTFKIDYFIKNATSDYVWCNRTYAQNDSDSLMLIVPRSILSIRDAISRIEIESKVEMIHGMHLLYKTDFTMVSTDYSDTVDVEEENNYRYKRLKISGG
ncbi:disease resistance protein RUN1 isoform X2 [Daucus carota subsp. sativus]|uniref:disease resistance protein RUN1 isoform X2 n=1 Tax=Daucus carota subsp. sativus TaxID=79200 RepID=UPI003082A78A